MKIALLSMDYPPRMAGGTTIHTYQLAKALDSLGHEVHVVSAGHPDAAREEIKENIHIHRVRRPYSIFSAYKTKSLLKELDVIHGHGICAYGHLMLNKFPTVVKMHNTWLGEQDRYKRLESNANITRKMDSATMMKLYIKMDKTCCQKADHLICISEVIKNETKKYGISDGKMTVIHNGIDYARFDVKNDENYRDELKLKGPVVGYIGRLEPHKGVELLIKAARNIDAQFLLVGGGSDEARLKGLVDKWGLERKVRFTGYLPYDEIPKYYASVDIVVYPTQYEPLGNVVLEAMAAGKPIIASDVDGIPEIFKDGTGYLIKPSEREVTEKLRILVDDESLRKKMGAKGKDLVKGHSWIEVAKETIKVCEIIIG